MTETQSSTPTITGDRSLELLKDIESWGPVTTIVLHAGSVFEYKGVFPAGSVGHGFYNFGVSGSGFHGHLNLKVIDHISFQEKPHRGRESYALVFMTADEEPVFKVFLGRDEHGFIFPHQKEKFFLLKHSLVN